MAFVAMLVQPFADIAARLAALAELYDLDSATGAQLDVLGQWIGVSRNLVVPLPDVYFSWDSATLGWESATWLGPYDALTGLASLPDDAYRTLLRARIVANHWDGTVPGAYAVWAAVFGNSGERRIFLQDNQDMTMLVGIAGTPMDVVTKSLLLSGYLDLRPAGVLLAGYVRSSVDGTPMLGWDIEDADISGWDVGAWAVKES